MKRSKIGRKEDKEKEGRKMRKKERKKENTRTKKHQHLCEPLDKQKKYIYIHKYTNKKIF